MTLIIGLLIPLLGTMIGAAFVFLMKDEMSPRVQKSLLGFASGVMVAASVWSLLIPAMEMEADEGKWAVLPAAAGFLLGIGFLLLLDELTPHLHIGTEKPEGPRSRLSRTAMLALAVTIPNLPEGVCRCRRRYRRIVISQCFGCLDWYCHSKHTRRSHHLYAHASRREQQMAFFHHRKPEWCRRAYRSTGSCLAGFTDNSRTTLLPSFCRWSHVLCGCGRTHTRSIRG